MLELNITDSSCATARDNLLYKLVGLRGRDLNLNLKSDYVTHGEGFDYIYIVLKSRN